MYCAFKLENPTMHTVSLCLATTLWKGKDVYSMQYSKNITNVIYVENAPKIPEGQLTWSTKHWIFTRITEV